MGGSLGYRSRWQRFTRDLRSLAHALDRLHFQRIVKDLGVVLMRSLAFLGLGRIVLRLRRITIAVRLRFVV